MTDHHLSGRVSQLASAFVPLLLLLGCGSVRSHLPESPEAQRPRQASPRVGVAHDQHLDTEVWGTAQSLEGRILQVSGRTRDCNAEQIECFDKCWKKKPPYPYQRGKADHYQYCSTRCLNEYMKCLKDQGSSALQFPTMQDALDWLKRHQEDILAGTVVVVAGVTMVIIVAETGGLALVPLLAL
jgi:hypothetical protein